MENGNESLKQKVEVEAEKLKVGNGPQKFKPVVSGQCAYRCSYSSESHINLYPYLAY